MILSSQIRHVCPYKGQEVPLALCYVRSQDIEERSFCYACDHVPNLLKRFGLRTFKRRVVFSRCERCAEPASLHSDEKPYVGLRTNCPGFRKMKDQGELYVALNQARTQWMVVDAFSGVRSPLWRHNGQRRLQMPLVGAPGTVPSDWRDEARTEAAEFAARRREGQRRGNSVTDEDTNETTTARVKTRRRSK